MNRSSLFLDDRQAKLKDKGLESIYKTLENPDYLSATSDFFFENPLPSIWRKNNVIAVINFHEHKENIIVNNVENERYKDIFPVHPF